MKAKPHFADDVRGFTPNDLGTALYHIAMRTDASLGFTERFRRAVCMRAGEVLCAMKTPETDNMSLHELLTELLTSEGDDNRPIWSTSDEPEETSPYGRLAAPRTGYSLIPCISDPGNFCSCTDTERLTCATDMDLPDINEIKIPDRTDPE